MTKFDPVVAYRILAEKQRRLYDEAHKHLRARIYAQMDGHWYDEVFYEHDKLHDKLYNEANSMWEVLEYLLKRIVAEGTIEDLRERYRDVYR